jgi:hypothetical protein
MKFKQLTADTIVVHCSATPPTADIGRREIDQWHRAKSWLKIGYHVVIRRDGTIEWGRKLTEVGAHVEGHNSHTVGVCMVGGVNAAGKAENNFTPEQFDALEVVLLGLQCKLQGVRRICGHRDFPDVKKDCPSFDVAEFCKARGIPNTL